MANPHCKCAPKSFPFHCDRHCVDKTKRHFELCQLEADTGDGGLKYWNHWEAGADQNQECQPDEPILNLEGNDNRPQIKKTLPSRTVKAIRTNQKKLTWSYGVTTVEQRIDDLLPKTLASLANAGFDQPRLFIDGVSHGRAAEIETEFGLEVTTRNSPLKTYGNWILALWELYVRNPHADRFAIFQDDLTTYKNLRSYLEAIAYQDNTYLNLHTFPNNEKLAPKNLVGWYKSDQRGRSALALVFNNLAVRDLLHQKHMINKPRANKMSTKNVDGAILDSLKKIGYSELVHVPSLTQHHGKISSMGNRRHAQSRTYQGDDFDAIAFLPKPKIPPRVSGLGDQVEQALTTIGITSERVERWLGRPCNCKERKEKLNRLGRWAKNILSGEQQVETKKDIQSAIGIESEKILVAIPARDCEESTKKCLDHLKQNAGMAVDVLYLDDGSRPGVARSVVNYAQELKLPISLEQFDQPIGFAKLCNIAFHVPGYDYMLLLNNDCFIGPESLLRMKRWLDSDRQAAAVNPLTCDQGKLSLKHPIRRERAGVAHIPKDRHNPNEGAELCQNETATEETMLPFFCTLFKTEAITDIGLQSTDKNFAYGLGADDDWCRRAIRKGWKLLAANNAYAAHVHHHSFRKHNIKRNRYLFQAKKRLETEFEKPVLSVVTRVHPQRPHGLKRLKQSIDSQTVSGIDHVLIDSPGQIGIAGANRLIATPFEYAGDYVQVIDDDDLIVSDDYFESFQNFVTDQGHPDWILVRSQIRNKNYPRPFGISWKPKHATIPSFSIIVNRRLWDEHQSAWAVKKSGDWRFCQSLWKAGERPVWFDFVACRAQNGHSHGRGERKRSQTV